VTRSDRRYVSYRHEEGATPDKELKDEEAKKAEEEEGMF